jgi:hypothetical protein
LEKPCKSAPFDQPAAQTIVYFSQHSPKKPSTGLDFCAHLQGICLAPDSSIPVPGQKAVDGCHSAKGSLAGRQRARLLVVSMKKG